MKSIQNRVRLAALAFAVLFAGAAAAAPPAPQTFKSPEEAVRALAELVGSGDQARADQLFGVDSAELLSSGDEVADKRDAEKVLLLIQEKVAFDDAADGRKVALLGADEWPFPIPLVVDGGLWRFDTAAGKEELLNRRIGRNELLTIEALNSYLEAQRDYFAEGRDGNPPAYAQKIRSGEGRHDGLFWPTAEGEPQSPLGDLNARAAEEGYRRDGDPDPDPYHGYYYRTLTAQGKSAPGGEKSYLDGKGLMTGGFAVIAWPARYGKGGVMTFMVNQQGTILQKDLGAETEKTAHSITAYDPDETWKPAGD